MSVAAPSSPRRRSAFLVVRAMAAELQHQRAFGALGQVGQMDDNGYLSVTGKIDLARLALVTELVMTREGFL